MKTAARAPRSSRRVSTFTGFFLTGAPLTNPGSRQGVLHLRAVLRREDGARPVSVSQAGRGYTGADKIAGFVRKCK